MRTVEIILKGRQTLEFLGRHIGTIEVCDCNGLINCLAVHFANKSELVLPAAVDISELIHAPRIFQVEGTDPDGFMLLGGETAYWITTEGMIKNTLYLFRARGDEEYWTTRVIQAGDRIVIICEAEVLLIDASLRVCWHTRKYYNDVFVVVEDGSLKFVRDHDTGWTMRLEDGSASLGL